jgi:hypothetical protein
MITRLRLFIVSMALAAPFVLPHAASAVPKIRY